MRRSLLAVVLAACSPSQVSAPAPDDPYGAQLVAWHGVYQEAARKEQWKKLLVVRPPRFVVGDVIGLAHVPQLGPHLAQVAQAWPAICEARGELADDVLEYTLAWCAYSRGDDDRFAHTLERFATVPALRAAVQSDLTSIREAEPTPCDELERALEDFRPESFIHVERLASVNGHCGRAARDLLTSVEHPDEPTEYVLAAYRVWHQSFQIAFEHARQAMPTPGAEQVAVAALSGLLERDCTQLDEIHVRAKQLLDAADHDPQWTPHLAALASVTPETCGNLR